MSNSFVFIKFIPLLFLLCFSTYVETANILYVIPFSSMSHYISLRPIGLELARRGHNVTVITSKEEEDILPNYKQVVVDNKNIWNILEGRRPNVFTRVDMPAINFHHKFRWPGGITFTELILNSTKVKHFLKENNTFDLVITEQFYQEALYTLAYKYNTPLVLVTTFGNCMKHNIVNRNPLQLSTVVPEHLDLKHVSSFLGRLKNLFFTTYTYLWWRFVYLKEQEQLVKQYLPDIADRVSSIYELQRNVSLMLINSHFSFDTPTALLPNIVEIGGIHLFYNDTKLPQDLKKILDESINGVVYMNFGSNVKSIDLPEHKKNAFLNVFKRLKQTVILKWEDNEFEYELKNLVTRKWLPQKEILAHPNTKVFISHGGLLGTQEAIFYGVPLIGIPIFGDQYNNLLLVEENGFGKILKYHDINEQTFEILLQEILNNRTYTDNAKEISQRFKDRPLNSLDTAIFWIEYIIRNRGADFMKNPARNISWIAYSMIDVYIFIVLLFLFIIIISIISIRFAVKLIFNHQIQITKNKKYY